MTQSLDAISSDVQRDYPHTVGLAVYLTDQGGRFAYAAIAAGSEQVLAWDGRYPFENDAMARIVEDRSPLGDLPEWQNRDVSASQFMLDRNAAWLPILAELLYPSYSLTQLATRLLETRAEEGAAGLMDHADHVVAYFPTDATRP